MPRAAGEGLCAVGLAAPPPSSSWSSSQTAPAQTGKRCQPAGSVLPTDLACSSYFPLLSLAPVKEPARVLFALTLPVPSCSRPAGSPASGTAMRPLPIGWLWVMCSRAALSLKPLPIRFISFPPRCHLPATIGCLLGTAADAQRRCPEDTGPCTGLPGHCHATGQAGTGRWASPGLCQPMRRWDRSAVALSSRRPAPRKERAGPFLSSALARGRIRAGRWRDTPLFLHLSFLPLILGRLVLSPYQTGLKLMSLEDAVNILSTGKAVNAQHFTAVFESRAVFYI